MSVPCAGRLFSVSAGGPGRAAGAARRAVLSAPAAPHVAGPVPLRVGRRRRPSRWNARHGAARRPLGPARARRPDGPGAAFSPAPAGSGASGRAGDGRPAEMAQCSGQR